MILLYHCTYFSFNCNYMTYICVSEKMIIDKQLNIMDNLKLLLLAGGLSQFGLQSVVAKNDLPNIVFVLVDDMGIGDIGCYYEQKKIHTPNLNEWAAQSLQFMQHYSGSTVSAPSRCCLLTGKHTGHSYVRGNKAVQVEAGRFDLHLPEDEVTVAELLKTKGYNTMCVGKWGLGGPGTSGSPIKQGFDYFFGYLSQADAHRYYPQYLYENEEKINLGGKVYSHWLIMEKGLDFINKQTDEKPFFAYFAITPPHADLDYPDLSEYEDSFEETPYINNKGGFKSQAKPKAAYASMITEIDKNVGMIIETLKKKGMWENTIMIFSSDNGVHRVGGHNPDFFDSNGPFRGYKRDLYEGGIRTPFIVSWPKVIKKHRKVEHLSTFWDFMPTVCDIVGIDAPKNTDGISYLPTIKGKDKKQKKHDFIYYEFYELGGKQTIIKDGWKLLRLNVSKPKKLREELYYLPDDIGENNNIINENRKKADELRTLMKTAHTDSENFNF